MTVSLNGQVFGLLRRGNLIVHTYFADIFCMIHPVASVETTNDLN